MKLVSLFNPLNPLTIIDSQKDIEFLDDFYFCLLDTISNLI